MKARIHRPSAATIKRLARVLRRGGVVAVPTETVYGLAANALDAQACAKIFEIKGRPSTDPLIVHVPSLAAAEEIAVFNAESRRLAEAFWPGPLTLVLPKRECIPSIVTAGLDSVAVRVPRHPAFLRLLAAARLPLAAPSANPFGYISPTTAQHVRDSLGDKVGHILEGGACRVGLESTIVDMRNPKSPRILRPGWITAAEIGRRTGIRVRSTNAGKALVRKHRVDSTRIDDSGMIAPGMLSRHYSPRTPMRLVRRIGPRELKELRAGGVSVAWLFFAKPEVLPGAVTRNCAFWLSRDGDPALAARALFRTLRKLDEAEFDLIVAEMAPASDAGESLNDRLRRAAARS